MIDLQSVLTTLGSGAILLSAASWVVKELISEQLARETTAFKARLKAEADVEIEKLRNSLQIAATEHQVRFSRMHEKRAEVIEDIYQKLTELYWSGFWFVITSEGSRKPHQ